LQEIGTVVVLWGHVSRTLGEIASMHAAPDVNCSFFENGTEAKRLRDAERIVESVIDQVHRGAELLSVIGEIKAQIPARNLIIHGATGITRDRKTGKRIAVVTELRSDRHNHLETPFSEIVAEHLHRLRTLATKLDDLLREPILLAMEELFQQHHPTSRQDQE